MRRFTKVMKALSDPGRVKMIKMLGRNEELCVCQITAVLGLAQPTISKHLRILEDAELVQSRREGQWVHYALAAQPGSPFAQTLLEHLEHWLDDSPDIQDAYERLQQADKSTLCAVGTQHPVDKHEKPSS